MPHGRRPLAALLLLGVLAAGCGKGAPSPPLRVGYAGCAEAAERADGGWICCLDERHRTLRLWVETAGGEGVGLFLDGEPLTTPGVPAAGGLRFEIPLPESTAPGTGEGGSSLELRAAGGSRRWLLALRERAPPPPASGTAREHWRKSEDEATLEVLRRAVEAGPEASDRCRLLGRLALYERTILAQPEEERVIRDLKVLERLAREETEHLAGAAAACREAGHRLGEVDSATILIHRLRQQHRFAEAFRVLSALGEAGGGPAETDYLLSFYRAQLATATGELRLAGDALRRALGVAERLGLERERLAALEQGGLLELAMGRAGQAAETFRRLLDEAAPSAGPCVRGELLVNQAWALLLARQSGAPSADDPAPLLEEARSIHLGGGCSSPEKGFNVLLNLALAHLQGGRAGPARQALADAAVLEGNATTHQWLWQLDLRARLALEEGHPRQALATYGELDELARAALSPDGLWRAAFGRARAHEALGDRPAALAASEKAEELLGEEMLRVPVQQGRATLLSLREAATRFHLELLLASERPAEALAAVRRSRARVLRTLWRGELPAALPPGERERWYDLVSQHQRAREELDHLTAEAWRQPRDRLPHRERELEALRREILRLLDQANALFDDQRLSRPSAPVAPAPGELLLAYHPLPRGWVGLAATAGGVETWRFDLPPEALGDPAALSARLLAPARRRIEQARSLQLLPYGPLRGVDFHALPFGGSVLLAAAPVVYRLDLPAVPAAGPGRHPRALVITDPLLDLPAARREGEVVIEALRSAPGRWRVMHLAGREARGDAVLPALPGVDLLHYAGHGRFRGWESELELAGSSHLAVGDLLTLAGAPAVVVLSACETASSSEEASPESIGLAHAFLLAGSRSVVAAARPVGDEAARGLFGELYRRWGGGGDLAVALQQAQLAWAAGDPRADWASFRLLVP